MDSKKGKPLSARETECLQLAARGFASKRIAAELGIREATVAWHLGNACRKLDAANRAEAVALSIQAGLLGKES